MNEDSQGIFIAWTADKLFVRVSGRGTYQNAAPLRQYGQEAIQEGCEAICLDLAECQGLDSTFLGVLAGFGLRLRERGRQENFHLFNAAGRALHSCQSLGLDRLAQIESGLPAAPNLQPPPSPEFHRLQESDLVRPDNRPVKQRTATCMLEAHEDLCRADERNEAQFKDVKQFLREEVERENR